MTIQTMVIGGNHGADFDIQAIRSIGFRATNMVAAILLNGEWHGDRQGEETLVLEFQQDEYINKLVVYESYDRKKEETCIRGVQLRTSRGRKLDAGTLSGPHRTLENVRILGLGGNGGDLLFMLRARYIAGYAE